MSVRELGLENDGRIVTCEVIGGGGRWVKCTHCRNHRGCRVCDNGENLAGTLYRMWGREGGGAPASPPRAPPAISGPTFAPASAGRDGDGRRALNRPGMPPALAQDWPGALGPHSGTP